MTPPAEAIAGLGPVERRVLTLLGEGHTAKSIAGMLDLSEGAVNERLRAARRKTGIGSSRELARLLRAQENRDDQIGMGIGAATGEATATGGANGSRRWTREIVVMILILAAATAAFIAHQADHRNATPTHPAKGTLFDESESPATLRGKLGAESVDREWAAVAQPALQSIYAPLRGVGRVEVRCGSTLCEVGGPLTPDPDSDAVAALQSPALVASVRAQGFGDSRSMAFGQDRFVAYWPRGAKPASAPGTPHVASTSPRDGATIAAGKFDLTVTYDRPMRDGSYSFTTPQGPERYPQCDNRPVRSPDHRSFTMHCTAQAGRTYFVGFNTPPYLSFVAQDGGASAAPHSIRFVAR